jgi:plasmid replication initiation protein
MKKSNFLPVLNSKTPKVYKDKKLNNANFGDLTHSDYKVFLHLVTKVGGVDGYGKYLQPEQLQREHVLTAKEFSQMFDVPISDSYGLLKKACKKLMKTSIFLNKIELDEILEVNVCSTAKYCEKEGRITIKFTDDIMPYLAQEAKQKFVLYNLKEVSGFHSLYTTRLYELIQEFKETGWIRKSVEELREIFAVGDKLKEYKDFKRRTFEHARQEINKIYDYGLTFKEFKEGRKVLTIEFSFKKTIVQRVINPKTGISSNIYVKPKKNITHELPPFNGFKSVTDAINGLGLL